MKRELIQRYVRCDFCGMQIHTRKGGVLKDTENKKMLFCSEDCYRIYLRYKQLLKKYGKPRLGE
jgi:ribosomal protein L24E